ncbi:MAG: hypothetical protein OJI67_08175 [Prosthecobacter sp.]|nr:hypothetical protein [Prosthecobacter sp.]
MNEENKTEYFILSLTKMVKRLCVFSAAVLSVGTALFGLIAGDFDPFFSFVVIPVGFALAALIGVLWTKFVIGPVHRWRSKKS